MATAVSLASRAARLAPERPEPSELPESLDEPDARELQDCIDDLRANAPLARLTLDYSEPDERDQRSATERLMSAYWDALAHEDDDEDSDYRLYIADIVRLGPPMKRAQALEAARRGQRDALIEGNLLLVVSVANRWSSLPWRSRLDLVQEGNIGLMRAAQKFDPARGASFAHYAYYWITRYVRNEAHRQDIPSGILPYTARSTIIELRSQQARLKREFGYEPTLTETVARLQAEQTPPPAHLPPAWPSVAEVQAWLSARTMSYLSEPVHQGHDRFGSPTTIGDLIGYEPSFDTLIEQNEAERAWHDERAARDDTEGQSCSRSRRRRVEDAISAGAFNLTQLVRDLARDQALSPAQVDLLVLRYGIAHPDPTWRAPARWRLGQLHGFRQVAEMLAVPRTTLQRRYTRLLAFLSLSSHPAAQRLQTALQAVSGARRGHRGIVDALIYLC